MTKKIKKKKKVLTEAQKRELVNKRREATFRKKIRSTFTNMGFISFSTTDKHFKIGYRVVELDYLFIYENVFIIGEDTCGKAKDKDHIRNKSEAFREIKNNMTDFIAWLQHEFPEKKELVQKYRLDRIQLYYLYFSQAQLELTDDEKSLYSNLIFWETDTLAYFNRMSQCIYYATRYDLFRFLGLTNDQIGSSGSAGSKTVIKAPIIYPEDITGFRNGVRIVSFMMSAEKLLKTCYVLRKDNWEESIWLYQRLIEKEKIKKIRAFLANKGSAFYNNIIVALPDSVRFEDESGNVIKADKMGDFQRCSLIIPEEMNTVCVIDGQHRIFAHYEAPENEKYESIIAPLRKQLHLLVTGLIFPDDMKESDRKKLQSEIFLEINSNAKMVPADVLLHIRSIKDPLSDIGIARRVVEKLNRRRTFLNRFELSALDEGKIKVASIIKFALRYLVTITPAEGKMSLFDFWDGNKGALLDKDEEALTKYIDFCARNIDLYFSTVRDTFKEAWNDPTTKILSVTALNGFIIAYNRQLASNGIMDYSFYNSHLKNLKVDFSKEAFPYTSSQYRKFSSQILTEAFDFTSEELEAI